MKNPKNWPCKPLGSLCEFQNGYAFKSRELEQEGNDKYEVFRMGNIARGGGLNHAAKRAYLSKSKALDLQRFLLNKNDIVMSMTDMKASMALLGHTAVIDRDDHYLQNQRVGRICIRERQKLDLRYLYYYSNSFDYISHLRSVAHSGVQVNLSTAAIRSSPIILPPLFVQRKIGQVLGSHDDLIENNTRRIKILEEMVRLIYREWFVHFRFPGHEKVNTVDSAVGPIPEGWEIITLGTLIGVDKGISYSGKCLTTDGNPLINLKNILPGGGFRRDATKPYSGKYKPSHTVRPGDIILANTDLTQVGNVVGSPALVPQISGDDLLITHHLYAIRLHREQELPRLFVYQILLSDSFKAFARAHASGTTVLGLRPEGVLGYRFVKPSIGLAAKFDALAEPYYLLMENLWRANEKLRETRDFLLPKLISGEIDLSGLDIDTGASAA